jgi:hypothetical protein
LGSFLIIIIILLIRNTKEALSIMDYIEMLSHSKSYILIIYACIFILITVAFEIHFSDEYKASWVYQAAPIQKPGDILSGTLKAILVRFFIPLYMIASAIILFIWGEKVIADLVFGMLACILLMLSIFILVDKHLPLSLEPTARNQGGSFVRVIFSILVIGAFGTGHYFLTNLPLLIWIGIPVLAVSCYAVLQVYRNIEWKDLKV